MKKNSKKGFSLAEVLISVGIVSVIATLGFSVARTNLDRAYNMYVYTGAKYLSDAITDAELRNQAGSLIALTNHLQNLFNASIDGDGDLVTRNGIEYTIVQDGVVLNTNTPIFNITMTVPTRRGQEISYSFFHVNEERYPALFPEPNLADRIDLIKYYIREPGQPDIPRNRVYYNFEQAACGYLRNSVSLTNSEGENLQILDCQNVNVPQQVPQNGILTMARP